MTKKDPNKELINKLLLEIVENEILLEGDRLRDIVMKPARELASTIAYGAEALSATFQKTVKGLSFIVPTLIVPGLEFQYDLFAKDEEKRMDAIKKKYGEALDSNWEAIKDPDVFGFLMLAYPQTLLSFAALKKSPVAFLNVLEIATGGMPAVRNLRQNIQNSSAYTPRKRQNFDSSLGGGGSGGGMGGDSYGDYGGGLYEEPQLSAQPVQPGQPVQQPQPAPQQPQPGQQDLIRQIQVLIQTPEVQQSLAQSPLFKDMQAQAVELFVDPVRRVFSAKTIEDLKNFIPAENIDKAKAAISGNEDFKKTPPEEQKKVLDSLVGEIKVAYKREYMEWLQRVGQEQPEAKQEIVAATNAINNLK